jgi:uncharacterized protein (DUF1684 family)
LTCSAGSARCSRSTSASASWSRRQHGASGGRGATADATSGRDSYGGGRYLLDTVKGADLGGEDGRLVLDFNFAYNPSCAYNPRWTCPLPPRQSRLPLAVTAGEHTFAP